MPIKRVFLLGVIASLSLAALLGIWVLVFDSFFFVEEEICATLGSVLLFSIPALAASALWEKRHWPVVMLGDVIICVGGLLFYIMVIWEIGPWDYWNIYWFSGFTWKTMLLSAIWAWALPWAALIAKPDLRNWGRLIKLMSIIVVFAVAAAISIAMVSEIGEESVWKCIGVLGILTALGTIVVPLLYKISGIDKLAQVESTAMELSLTCPRCLFKQTVSNGHSRCRQCRLKFHIEIEEPRCPGCNYLLHKLTQPLCPECGRQLSGEEVVLAQNQ